MKAIKSYLILNMPAPATLENSFGFLCTTAAQIMNSPFLIYIKYFTQQLLFQLVTVRACLNEPGTVNYPGASVTSRLQDDLLSRVNFISPGQVHRHLITTNLFEFL